MTRILLIKTSSLGDVVHNLPVVSDIRRALPGATIDWVVEEAFAAIPALHPDVARVIPVAVRRWRKAFWRKSVRQEVAQFVTDVRGMSYDAIIDTQGLLKSAWIARCARGVRHGLDWASSREPLGWAYDHTYAVAWTAHAVQRNRTLAARALHYPLDDAPDYRIERPSHDATWLPVKPYAVLLHATSADEKLWPEAQWLALGAALAARGCVSVLPWGNAKERERSERLGGAIAGAVVPPAMNLTIAAALLGGARQVVGVDTGLSHLAAALGVPTVGIYCATDPAATGLYGGRRISNLGGIGATVSVDEVLQALDELESGA